MKIVIDIDEDTYRYMQSRCKYQNKGDEGLSKFVEAGVAIKNGTPLPKGHGRLIDADYLKDVILLHSFHGSNKYIVPYSDRKGYRLRDREVLEGIINAPTIIEADGGDADAVSD